jgi:hypothetical protein
MACEQADQGKQAVDLCAPLITSSAHRSLSWRGPAALLDLGQPGEGSVQHLRDLGLAADLST